jgi:hypothetical protein
MISLWYARSEHSGNRMSLLVNPPDIGLTAPLSNFHPTLHPVRRVQPDRLREALNKEDLP